ncbi:putative Ubiquitin hydrolase [Leptomonas pyrrhocoris]|uniref:Ubiquitin carboxyl-terminal hydrolase n=1 Tax=Leptomonas pyrrhocoris TaxID=157538 RepID=A0A0M9G260_LEPPY|nr:putative Ubiquitin hydrolase [Leptomonas pyrrhocoris]XP_015659075.1 putative Ubiquitin hydrolase [Leptomonas pyrrhocoris]KPA80635.1 putative Ubiquitin hydrolase [Leptomonas pyrrhocoris]KPA80636.1 putative Ubiquitin hydrolase [Leptomonas pyrrhocoris]|eukprot:XP_015659074.1 putative Ubiquitin hydrolase [Leptomonas pyrrhocoris]
MPFRLSQEACPHAWDDAAMTAPYPGKTVHRDECAYCCRTCRHGDGVYVCMACHTGVCGEHLDKHQALHAAHVMYTTVKELPTKEGEAVKDVNYLGVVAAKEYATAVCCADCQVQFAQVPDLAVEAYGAIINAPVPGAQDSSAENALGRLQKPQCPHLVCLEQLPSPFTAGPPTSDDVCSVEGCDCSVNNWMCVTCGAIGCPRAEAGGNGHAKQHYALTGHPASVKLGTVTEQGADYYCYACDDDVDDVHFAAHMAHFGIDIRTAKKTAKTMGELEYDYSSQFDFNKITEAGANLVPVYGPGHTGMYNIGNTCYLASVVQCLMSFAPFQHAFYPDKSTPHQAQCTADPYNCRYCQTERVAAGLLSGEFSREGADATNAICPRLFKKVFAQQHPEFSTGAQQDAQEYLLYLLEEMQRHVRCPATTSPMHPTDSMEMVLEQRVQCNMCHKVRYSYEKDKCLSLPIPVKPVSASTMAATATAVKLTEAELDAVRPRCSLTDCLQAAITPNEIECRCEACGEAAVYSTVTRLASFPDVLPVYIRRTYFDAATLSTNKMDAYVEVPQQIVLDEYRGSGLRAGEALMPAASATPTRKAKTDAGANAAAQEVDEVALVSVISMGIDLDVARYALLHTSMNVERAIDYIFSHPDIAAEAKAATEAPAEGSAPAGTAPADGATTAAASIPKAATDGAASYELTAMISHMGASARTGHYVCHIRDAASGAWLLFNDEKVGVSQNPPFSMASLYFFQRKA